VVRSATKVTKDVIEAASKLVVIGRAGKRRGAGLPSEYHIPPFLHSTPFPD
jgi:hypothetical protein